MAPSAMGCTRLLLVLSFTLMASCLATQAGASGCPYARVVRGLLEAEAAGGGGAEPAASQHAAPQGAAAGLDTDGSKGEVTIDAYAQQQASSSSRRLAAAAADAAEAAQPAAEDAEQPLIDAEVQARRHKHHHAEEEEEHHDGYYPAPEPEPVDPLLPYPGNPAKKDWASVVSACRAVTIQEKRFCNFWTRASFHDALAIQPNAWATESGQDASMFLNATELARAENIDDDFGVLAGRSALRIAQWFKVSVADALAVCAASCITELNGPDVLKLAKLRVGRRDNPTAAPPDMLLNPNANTADFAKFFKDRGFSVAEGLALMGSHSLIDLQRCYRGRNNDPQDYCDPTLEPCTDVRMFNFSGERFFTDVCTPKIAMVPDSELPPTQTDGVFDPAVTEGDVMMALSAKEYESMRVSEMCSWTSTEMRRSAMSFFSELRSGMKKGPVIFKNEITPIWVDSRSACNDSSLPAVLRDNCPHGKLWPYTANDGWTAAACQGLLPPTKVNKAMQAAALSYLNRTTWQQAYADAYVKMTSQAAHWATPRKVFITGRECHSGWFNPSTGRVSPCATCTTGGEDCPDVCICRTAFNNGKAAKAGTSLVDVLFSQRMAGKPVPKPDLVTSTVQALFNDPTADDPGVDPIPIEPVTPGLTEPDELPAWSNVGPNFDPLASPYIVKALDRAAFCHPATDVFPPYQIGGFPSSPFRMVPFTKRFFNPPTEHRQAKACRPDGHCIVAYDIPTKTVQLDVFSGSVPACNGNKTWFMAYNGTVPGPTLIGPVGHEVAVHFRNRIGAPFELGHAPCNAKLGRPTGRPIAVHLHGSASLAPWDGWAEDETCSGEEKTYVYPNNRPTTGWYHDHGLHITAENAYYGLAGMYIMSDKTKHGGCGSPYNLDDMEELRLILADRLINTTCQLHMDNVGAHRNNIYGDITLVNGVPFPYMDLAPKWYHMRLLNTGITRPYLVKLKNSTGHDVHHELCYVFGSDGGYRNAPARFPIAGLLMGVAERYEVACDFSQNPGETYYLWNGFNGKFMKDVPYFCYTHLIAKINVAASLPAGQPVPPVFDPALLPADTAAQQRLFSAEDYAKAFALAKAGRPHRRMKFGRRNGHWVVNGETWDTFKLAAADIGQNTWELWELKTGGGWFHPIHIHLVDFFIIYRSILGQTPDMGLDDNVFDYERHTPKDVIYLGPSQKVYVVARFGPHRGDYMFHCHNLIHEDNDMMRSMRMVGIGKNTNTPGNVLPIQNLGALALYDQYENPMFTDTAAKPTDPANPIAVDEAFAASKMALNGYRIFYAEDGDEPWSNAQLNPWKFVQCNNQPPDNNSGSGGHNTGDTDGGPEHDSGNSSPPPSGAP